MNFPRKQPRIILASASPRRAELLRSLDVAFEVFPSPGEEARHGQGPPEEHVEKNAVEKAAAVAARHSEGLVVGADTIVWLDGRVFGKPQDMEDAHRMLSALAGRTHQVFTGIAIIRIEDNRQAVAHAVTDVTFRALSDQQISRYLRMIDPLDKAGAYAIQGAGGIIIEKICGCYYNVVGLPLHLLDSMLARFGVQLL